MKNHIMKATATIFFLTLIAKLLGFAKSIVQASYFGATLETDIFNVAEGFVANILYMLTTAIAVAFVPMYIQHKKSEIEGRKFASRTITFFTIGIIGFAFVLLISGKPIMKLVAPYYSGAILDRAILYFRVLLLGVVFSLNVSMYQQLLNAEKIYGFSAISSVVNSIAILLCIILLYNQIGIWALVVASLVSQICQFLVVYFRGHKFGNYTFQYGIWDNTIKILIMQSVPILISQATVEINQVVDRALLASAGKGAITAASYAAILYRVIAELVNIPISTVMFTELSEAGAKNDKKKIAKLLDTAYRVLVLACLPIMIIMFFCSTECTDIVYGHGNYSEEAIAQTSIAFRMYGFCVLPSALNAVLTKAYYGLNDTKRPMLFGILNVITNIVVSIILSRRYGIAGVVGGTAVATSVWIIVMLMNFDKNYMGTSGKNVLKMYWKNFFAGAVTIAIMYIIKDVGFANSLVSLCIKTIITFGCYVVLLLVLREKMLWTIVRKGNSYLRYEIRKLQKK